MTITARYFQTCPKCFTFHATWGRPVAECRECGNKLDPSDTSSSLDRARESRAALEDTAMLKANLHEAYKQNSELRAKVTELEESNRELYTRVLELEDELDQAESQAESCCEDQRRTLSDLASARKDSEELVRVRAELAASRAAAKTSNMWQGEVARLLEELIQAVKRA